MPIEYKHEHNTTQQLNKYLVRYWMPGKKHEIKQIVVKGLDMQSTFAKEKEKVDNADSYSWSIDSEQVTGQFDSI